MPRLSSQQYISTRNYLAEMWLSEPGAWANISPADQRALHDYFDPSLSRTDQEARVYRQAITAKQPSLPQRAGRALKRFERVAAGELEWAAPPLRAVPRGRQARHAIAVKAELQPHPDISRFARALVEVYAAGLSSSRDDSETSESRGNSR